MAKSCSFMDNCTYGAEDINLVLSKLTSKGVSLFNYSDGDNPLMSLNEAVSSMVEPGVEYFNMDSCRLSYDEENNTFMLLEGNAFMYDGSIISIDADGYDISEDVKQIRLNSENDIYVCFLRNADANDIIVSVKDNPGDYDSENAVKIGKITGTKTIIDERTYSKTKLIPCTSNIYEDYNFGTVKVLSSSGNTKKKYASGNVNLINCEYVSFKGDPVKIQRVITTTGEELEYTEGEDSTGTYMYAFNLVGNELEFWAYTTSSYNKILDIKGMIF